MRDLAEESEESTTTAAPAWAFGLPSAPHPARTTRRRNHRARAELDAVGGEPGARADDPTGSILSPSAGRPLWIANVSPPDTFFTHTDGIASAITIRVLSFVHRVDVMMGDDHVQALELIGDRDAATDTYAMRRSTAPARTGG